MGSTRPNAHKVMRWRIGFRTDSWICICHSRIMLKANKPANNNGRRTPGVMAQRHVQHLPGLSNRAEKRIAGPGSFFLLNPTTVTPRGVSLIAPNHRNRVWLAAGNVTRFEHYFTKQPAKFVDGLFIRLHLNETRVELCIFFG